MEHFGGCTLDVQLNSLKTNFKLTFKLTLKSSDMLRCKHHLQGAHNCNFSKFK